MNEETKVKSCLKIDKRRPWLYPEDLTDDQIKSLKNHLEAEEKPYKRLREGLDKKSAK